VRAVQNVSCLFTSADDLWIESAYVSLATEYLSRYVHGIEGMFYAFVSRQWFDIRHFW
jgi:hypothetical protein